MIEGCTILCLASGYDAPPTSKHHVMHLLAERNTVLWVNYHASRTPTASSSDMAHMARKLAQVFAGLSQRRKNLFVLTPLVIPLPSSPWARQANRALLLAQIRRALSRLRNGPLQIWSFTPDVAYALGHFGEEKVVYYCVDDHASFTGYDRQQVLRDEQALCRRADLVVTTSMALQKAKAPWNPNTILVPHGVDYEHFSRAVREDLPCPPDIAAIPHPRLGFFGLIRDWVDLDLLAEVARRQPDWHIVMIGDADSNVNLARYRAIRNIHFLGRRPYEDLPAYCRQFDVGLIPFKINELTKAVNPIKLREYLAADLPVVSTPLPAVKHVPEGVKVSSDGLGFERAIGAFLDNVGRSRPALAARMARETWPSRLDIISRNIGEVQRASTRRDFLHLGQHRPPRQGLSHDHPSRHRIRGNRQQRTFRWGWYSFVNADLIALAQRELPNLRNQSVLYVGCGESSTAAAEMAACGADVWCLDIDPESIAKFGATAFGEVGDRIHPILGDAENMPFPDRFFDAVFGKAIVHHLDLGRFMTELNRAAKPGARFVFCEPLGLNPVINLVRQLTPELRDPDEHPLLPHDLQFIRERSAGLRTRFVNLLSLFCIPLCYLRFAKAGRLVYSVGTILDRALLPIIPGLRWLAWNVLITGSTMQPAQAPCPSIPAGTLGASSSAVQRRPCAKPPTGRLLTNS